MAARAVDICLVSSWSLTCQLP